MHMGSPPFAPGSGRGDGGGGKDGGGGDSLVRERSPRCGGQAWSCCSTTGQDGTTSILSIGVVVPDDSLRVSQARHWVSACVSSAGGG